LRSGGETGVVLFFELAQQLLFAQQFGLQPSALGAFERMQEAAGSWSGRTTMASTTANRIVAVFRINQTVNTKAALRRIEAALPAAVGHSF
jgi:hypothetical protein